MIDLAQLTQTNAPSIETLIVALLAGNLLGLALVWFRAKKRRQQQQDDPPDPPLA